MADFTRRGFLSASVTATGAAAGYAVPGRSDVPRPDRCAEDGFDSVSVAAGDPRYEDLAQRTGNARFAPRPEEFELVTSTEQVLRVVGQAVRAQQKIAVRSGGHCYENFVSDPAVHTVIDMSEMDKVYFDRSREAFVIEPGAQLLDMYQRLFFGWGVTVPGGASQTVAAGGHIQGGGYGPHSRQFGISADHLYGVEVVVVDESGRARAVIATREPEDPNRDLWWAHTGAGGGSFGVVTKYFMRSPGITSTDPRRLLPRAPSSILAGTVMFERQDMTKESYRRLMRNYGRWHEHNSSPESPYAAQFNGLVSFAVQAQDDPGVAAMLFSHIDAGIPGARQLLDDSIAEITEGVATAGTVLPVQVQPWLSSMTELAKVQDGAEEGARHKIKTAFLRRSYTDEQIDTIHDYLNAAGNRFQSAHLSLQSYGCAANAVPPADSASPQRGSVLRALYLTNWQDEAADGENIDWTRRLFRDVHADTGGVPAPGDRYEGCYINFPDVDMADPAWNTSGVPWQRLFWGDVHPRLQQVKRRWDPGNIFNHALSVQL